MTFVFMNFTLSSFDSLSNGTSPPEPAAAERFRRGAQDEILERRGRERLQAGGSVALPRPRPQVPAPPSLAPRLVDGLRAVMSNSFAFGGSNVVLIAFRPGATRAQKRGAIDAVGGTLIGGNRAYYYVRVDAGCAGELPLREVTQLINRENALVVVDLPFMSYHVSMEDALRNAGRLKVGRAVENGDRSQMACYEVAFI